MIINFKEVISEKPTKQIWKELRYFLDINMVSKKIRKIHDIEDGKHQSNIKKQAQQINYSLRQAEEYFHASSQVDLATRPLLLYYGAVSLSQALMLLKLDGKFSIDFLRENQKHRHHGLELKIPQINMESPNSFLKSIYCKVHTNDGNPWGHFPLFYKSLVNSSFFINMKIKHNNANLIKPSPIKSADLLDLDNLSSQRISVYKLIKELPDLFFNLFSFDISPSLCRGEFKIEQLKNTKNNICNLYVNGVTEKEKNKLLNHYENHRDHCFDFSVDDFGNHLILKWNLDFEKIKNETYYLPDIIDDIHNNKFLITNPKEYIIEPASHLIILFSLGMLARYYPDKWVKAIDENIKIAELIDSILNIIYRKFPNLILNQMTLTKYYVHY